MSSLPEHNLRKQCEFIIRCECGFEISLVPDLKMMTEAIEAHAAQHREGEKNPAKKASEHQRIEIDLITRTLKAAASFTENKPL